MRQLILFGGPLLALALGLSLANAGLSSEVCWTAGITLLCAIWWVAETIPIPITALLPLAVFPLVGVLTPNQVGQAYGNPLILLYLGGFMLSMAMEKSGAQQLSTYASALQYLSSTPLLIPNFFALAGTRSGEGAILTRDPEAGKAEVVALGTAQLGGESWFVAVTNSDITIQPNFSNPDSRIAATLTHMKAVGAANVDLQALWDVLSKPPVFASDTLHTELMLPASGEYTTRLRVHQLQ